MDHLNTLDVLKKLERGEISADQANERLDTPTVERIDGLPLDKMELPRWVRAIWYSVLAVGTLIVVFGAWILAASANTNIFWFLLGIPIVLIGSLVIVIGASAFSGHWLYVNVEESRRNRHTIRFGIPFPIGLLKLGLWFAPWAIRQSKVKINNSNFEWDDPADLLDSFERELKQGRGITIDVNDRNARVQVYIV